MNSVNVTLGSILRFIAVVLLIVLILVYVQFQARNILLGPTISLNDSYEAIQHERMITLQGMARNIVKLTLNGREIHTTEQGDFTQILVLENGYTIIELTAQDRFGRVTSLRREYVFVPQST